MRIGRQSFGMGTISNGYRGDGIVVQSVPQSLDPTAQSAPDTMAVLNNAKTALTAAGYSGAECHQETVYYPPNGSYVQNICSAPGYTGGTEANLVALMSPAQLAAQRAYEVASGEGTSATPSYFQQTVGAPNIAIGKSTAPSGGAGANVAPDWFSTLQSQQNKVASQVTGAAAPPATPSQAPGTQGTGGSNNNTAANSSSGGVSLIPGIPDMYLYIGAALAAFLLLKGGK